MAKDDKENVARDEGEPEKEASAPAEPSMAKASGAEGAPSSGGEKISDGPSAEETSRAASSAEDTSKAAGASAEVPAKESEGEKPSAKKASGKKKSSEAAAKKGDKKPEKGEAVPAAAREHAAPEAHGGHGHAPNRRQYFIIFGVLFALTVLEVGLAKMPGISSTLMAIGLIGMALTKAACVGLFYMHLKDETKILRMSVMLPFAAPAIYALVLISDAAWRLTR